VTIDADALRQLQFMQALAAATPSVFITPVLIALNVAVFVAMVAGGASWITPTPEVLIRWGAGHGPLTTHGQWWRLVTAMFVHIGVVHLLMNMVVLWSIGMVTERLFGNVGFIVLYLGAGLAGSFTSLFWHPLAATAGASGAIFGLYGALFGFLLIRRASIPADTMVMLAKSGSYFMVANLLYGVIARGVDLSAHLGGFVAGIPLGCALAVPLAADLAARIRRSVLVAVSSAALAGIVAVRIPTIDDWEAELKRLTRTEQDSAALYDTSLDKVRSGAITREEFARVVDGTLIPTWQAERAAITRLRVPEPQRTAARRLGDYMSLKAEAWHLTAEGLRTNDATTIQNGNVKLEAALLALQAVRPDANIVNRLGQLRVARAQAEAFAAEMQRLAAAEKNGVKVFNDSLASLNAGRISADQFANTIETQVLRPWNAEREKLSGLTAPQGQEDAAKTIVDYMSLRSEAWLLTSQGIRSNDPGLIQKGAAKQAEAVELAKSLGAARTP
jgi:rhomboid protease GluP